MIAVLLPNNHPRADPIHPSYCPYGAQKPSKEDDMTREQSIFSLRKEDIGDLPVTYRITMQDGAEANIYHPHWIPVALRERFYLNRSWIGWWNINHPTGERLSIPPEDLLKNNRNQRILWCIENFHQWFLYNQTGLVGVYIEHWVSPHWSTLTMLFLEWSYKLYHQALSMPPWAHTKI